MSADALSTVFSGEVNRLDAKITELEILRADIKKMRLSAGVGSGADTLVASACDTHQAVSSSRDRNRARRLRRNRRKENHVIARMSMLQARPQVAQLEGIQLSDRVAYIEAVLHSQLPPSCPEQTNDEIEWSPWQSAVPAAILQQQCIAAGRIQVAWRRFRCRRGAFVAPMCNSPLTSKLNIAHQFVCEDPEKHVTESTALHSLVGQHPDTVHRDEQIMESGVNGLPKQRDETLLVCYWAPLASHCDLCAISIPQACKSGTCHICEACIVGPIGTACEEKDQ